MRVPLSRLAQPFTQALTLALVLVGGAGPAAAQRPSIRAMDCADAQGLVLARGAIVLTTGPGTYERIVRGGRYCSLGEMPRPFVGPTRDNPACFVGYRCVNDEPYW